MNWSHLVASGGNKNHLKRTGEARQETRSTNHCKEKCCKEKKQTGVKPSVKSFSCLCLFSPSSLCHSKLPLSDWEMLSVLADGKRSLWSVGLW